MNLKVINMTFANIKRDMTSGLAKLMEGRVLSLLCRIVASYGLFLSLQIARFGIIGAPRNDAVNL